MLPLDIERFWQEDEIAHRDNCFSPEATQVALGIRMSPECVYTELGEPGKPWLQEEPARARELFRRYNDKAEQIVGIRLLDENFPAPDQVYPPYRRIGEWFAGRYIHNENSEWLESDIKTPQELEKMLDRLERTDLREFMLPPGWEAEKRRIHEQYGTQPPGVRHIRGPVTLAMSIFGVESFIFLCLDEPELAQRFGAAIADATIRMAEIADQEAGLSPEDAPHGFSFADDNCCLLTPELYEMFGYPILKQVFARFSPDPDDMRYQHSDSAMEHLLPILARLDLNGVNFGPTVMADEIRQHMPRARIDGCIAPFTFMRNEMENLIAEVRRDCDNIRKTGTRGLNISTAGSINDGSSLESMRVIMAAIQTYGRY